MTSKRKVAKLRKMEVMKVIKKIKQYRFPFDYKYGGGYFIFSFDADEFNLHVTFRQLPMMKFGIWKTKSYGDENWHFFAECLPYIDKFKPSRSSFGWDNLEYMMEWVSRCIKEPKFYISELEKVYDESFMQILKDHADDLYRDFHNGFDQDEYETHLKAFNKLIAETNPKDYDIFWRRSDGFRTLYDVWFYPEKGIEDIQFNDFIRKLNDCKCFSFDWRPLPPHFFKHKNQYRWKIYPGYEYLYFNQKKHLKYFNHPDKS